MSNKIMPVAVRASQDELHMAYMGVRTDNRVLGAELSRLQAILRGQAERRAAKRRVLMAAMRLLGWFTAGLGCGVSAIACAAYAPWWTSIAPLVLLALAWREAGKQV